MNNPFLKWVNNQYLPLSFMEQLPTIFFTWGVYIKLLFWPLVLTNDYYPKHIDIMDMNNIWVWFSLLLNLGLLIIALFLYKRNKVISFGIFYYFITFSIVSNLIFPIGTHMAERFIFMPSLGFSVALAAIITQLPQKMNRLVILISTIFMIFFATKTVSRNLDWKNNYSLFMKDVTSSPNSAKALCAAGGVLLEDMGKKSDVQKETDIKRSMLYLEKALQIHPTYENAMLLLGNAYFYKNELEKAITCYRKVLETYPDQQNAKTNLAMTLRDYGKYLGETKGDVVKAKSVLEESLTIVPDDIETLRLLAVANGFLGDHIKAIDLFNKVLEKQPQNPNVYINLSEAYRIIGDKTAAETFKVKALQLDPNILNK
jgi:tetratricopeptide (TPR) repeat protein